MSLVRWHRPLLSLIWTRLSQAIKMGSNYSCNHIGRLIFEMWHWDQSHSAGAVGDVLCILTCTLSSWGRGFGRYN